MKDRLVEFIATLRDAGLRPSPAESLDAMAAVSAAGLEREVLREALASSLVKDHADRPSFDDAFDRFFAAPGRRRGKRKQPRSSHEGVGAGPGGEGAGQGRARPDSGVRGSADRERAGEPRRRQAREDRASRAAARRRQLREMPFREMGPDDVEEAAELGREMSRRFRCRWSRRLRHARHGRLDMRRTIRRSMGHGGVPIELLLRRPRPGKTDLIALVDLSYSTATAAEFLLSLLAPAGHFFRRRLLFGYVDEPVEISFEQGQVIPHEALDLNARSDFGKVLQRFCGRYEPLVGRNSVLLVLGDARNNRRPPRTDLLARLRERVRAVVWLNPEIPPRWNTGDSVMATYARHTDLLLAAHDLRSLDAALRRVLRKAL